MGRHPKIIKFGMAALLASLVLVCLGVIAIRFGTSVSNFKGNFELNEKSFKPELFGQVEKRIGITLPRGTRGLNLLYRGFQIDPFFVAKVSIPATSGDDIIKQVSRFSTHDLTVSNPPTAKLVWWKLSRKTARFDAWYDYADCHVHVALCDENGDSVLYLEWYVV